MYQAVIGSSRDFNIAILILTTNNYYFLSLSLSFSFSNSHSGDDDYTCISFQSINSAFLKARDKYGLPRPHKPASANDLANLATVMIETVRTISKQ